MLRHKALVAAAAAVLCSAGFAQADTFSPILAADEASAPPLTAALNETPLGAPMKDAGITVGGWVQASWTYNFDSPDNQTNVLRVFDFEDQDPTLNQVVLFIDRAVAYDKEKFDIGGRMEWMWGGDARLIHANGVMDGGQDDDEQFDPTQFYIDMTLPVGNGLKLRVGKYVTTLGYETINPTLNAFYSHSFLFGYAIPFTHLGVQANYQFSDSFEGYFGVVRGWEQGFEDVNDMVSFMLGGGWTIDENHARMLAVCHRLSAQPHTPLTPAAAEDVAKLAAKPAGYRGPLAFDATWFGRPDAAEQARFMPLASDGLIFLSGPNQVIAFKDTAWLLWSWLPPGAAPLVKADRNKNSGRGPAFAPAALWGAGGAQELGVAMFAPATCRLTTDPPCGIRFPCSSLAVTVIVTGCASVAFTGLGLAEMVVLIGGCRFGSDVTVTSRS